MCLVASVSPRHPAATALYTPADVRDARDPDGVDDRPVCSPAVTSATAPDADRPHDRRRALADHRTARGRRGAIATALADSAALLGWSCGVTDDRHDALTERSAG